MYPSYTLLYKNYVNYVFMLVNINQQVDDMHEIHIIIQPYPHFHLHEHT